MIERLNQSKPESENTFEHLGLQAGSEVHLVKLGEDGSSGVASGTELVGTLADDVEIGKPIVLREGANTTSIQSVEEKEGKILIRTRTSVYELVREAEAQQESAERQPKSITTAQGSTYMYLEDGRTQRFKQATGEMKEPQDLLVFLPPWEEIADKAASLYPEIFNGIENQPQYEQIMLAYAQTSGKTMRPMNAQGQVIGKLSDIEEGEQVFVAFVNKETGKTDFHLPVAKMPKIGWNAFDTRVYQDKDGNTMRERHIGNQVTDIQY